MYQILFVVADSRHMDSRSKKFFESEIPQSIKRVINEVIKNLSSLSGHWYERLRREEAIVPELPNRSSNHPATASVSVSSNFFQVCGLYGV